MKILFAIIGCLFVISCCIAEGVNIISTEKEFRSSEGKEITLQGVVFRSKGGDYLVCDGFSALLISFDISGDDVGVKRKLTGIAKIYRSSETEDEWDRKTEKEYPFTHAGYHVDQLVLEKVP